MNCQETRALIHAYADGELDLVKSLEIEQHLQDCPDCARARTDIQEMRTALAAGSLRYPAPPELRSRIERLLPVTRPAGPSRRLPGGPWLALAASLLLVGLTGWGLAQWLTPPREDLLVRQLVASHIRSQMWPPHALDVESSDQHTVRPWFERGKLDFSPPVPDLTEQGYPLIGGRLDYLDDRPVAVLVYQCRKHVINLFIWRNGAGADHAPQARTQQSYRLVTWTHGGLTYWAVSSVNEADLAEFARVFRGKS